MPDKRSSLLLRLLLAVTLLFAAARARAQPADTETVPSHEPEEPFLPGRLAVSGGLTASPGLDAYGAFRFSFEPVIVDLTAARTLLADRAGESFVALDASIPWTHLLGRSLRTRRIQTLGLGLRSTRRGGPLPVTSVMLVNNVGVVRGALEVYATTHTGYVVVGEGFDASAGTYVPEGYARGDIIWAASIGVRVYP